MQYSFSDRISGLQPSAIREILKVTQDPSVISFAAGNPSPETFPAKEMSAIAADLFENHSAAALQYGISEGYGPLRELTAARYRGKYGIGGDGDDTIIVSGGQQGIELSAKVLCNEGDTVLCESPSFIGALNAFRSYRVNLTGIGMDEEGIDTDEVERALRTDKKVRLIYVIPTFQNPSGRTMSLGRRKRLLELAERYDVMILEDNPYFELRYSGNYVPPIKSMDTSGHVICVGSYSKVLSPGIRVGFVTAPRGIAAKITVAKQVSDVHTNLFFMMLVAGYLEEHDLDAHIEQIRALYTKKRDRMLLEAERSFDPRVRCEKPDGGLFLWAVLPDGYDGFELCRLASQKKVAAVPGSSFSVDESAVVPAIRMNFSLPTEEQIKQGCALLGQSMREYMK